MTTTAVRERPILFADRLVRAILDGRKTQTRRPVEPQPEWRDRRPNSMSAAGWAWDRGTTRLSSWTDAGRFGAALASFCPFGAPGDRLWVREAWATHYIHAALAPRELYRGAPIWYRADGRVRHPDHDELLAPRAYEDDCGRWRPSIHMPRWASRITLEVTDVRVERVQEISALDAFAEGITEDDFERVAGVMTTSRGVEDRDDWIGGSAEDAFARVWDEHYADTPSSWESNPWVWVVGFRRIEP